MLICCIPASNRARGGWGPRSVGTLGGLKQGQVGGQADRLAAALPPRLPQLPQLAQPPPTPAKHSVILGLSAHAHVAKLRLRDMVKATKVQGWERSTEAVSVYTRTDMSVYLLAWQRTYMCAKLTAPH